MVFSTTVLLLNLALESLCLWLALRGRRALYPVAIFVGYQLAFDLVCYPLSYAIGPMEFSLCYWGGHGLTDLLQLWVCRPEHWKSIFALYWIASLGLMVASIVWVWGFHHRNQQMPLAVVCGAICLFVVIAGCISFTSQLRWPIWAGMGLWAAAELAGSMGSVNGGIIYRSLCVASLGLLAVGSWQQVAIQGRMPPDESAARERGFSIHELKVAR